MLLRWQVCYHGSQLWCECRFDIVNILVLGYYAQVVGIDKYPSFKVDRIVMCVYVE